MGKLGMTSESSNFLDLTMILTRMIDMDTCSGSSRYLAI